MLNVQISTIMRAAAIWAAVLACAATGCSGRSVGALGGDATVRDGGPNDGGAFPDAAVLQPDGGGVQVYNVLGWYSQAFEHVGFVEEQGVNPADLENCNPWMFAVPGFDTWWVEGAPFPLGLHLFPYLGGPDEMGLMRVSGTLSEPGHYGHMGMYQRELSLSDAELLVCETVRRSNHCVMPRPDDVCVDPEPVHQQRDVYLTLEMSGPNGQQEHYELALEYDPQIDDGTTVLRASLSVPMTTDPDAEWEVFELDQVDDVQLAEERHWIYFERIEYGSNLAGWVMRHQQSDGLKISLSGESANNDRLYIWGHFPVTEVVFYP